MAFPGLTGADVINACKNDRSGTLRIVDEVSECRTNESSLSWNTEGPQGVPGPPGSQGPTGGFDVSRLYVVTCEGEESFVCSCEDRGGKHFISGTAVCPMTVNETQTYLHLTNYLEETEEFEAVCTSAVDTPDSVIASIYTPAIIKLICFDNSE